ncbi:hypothetical protein, partial [Prevotella sp.]|uniref:hypothetical protein n=1 Tax=Prevotella sp. TaxID=59823 RepID=UPI0030789E31
YKFSIESKRLPPSLSGEPCLSPYCWQSTACCTNKRYGGWYRELALVTPFAIPFIETEGFANNSFFYVFVKAQPYIHKSPLRQTANDTSICEVIYLEVWVAGGRGTEATVLL